MKNFRTFNLATTFYRLALELPLKADAKDQIVRAARSIALNLAEVAPGKAWEEET